MSDIKMLKFETFIKEIDYTVRRYIIRGYLGIIRNDLPVKLELILELIYDYDNCNSYAQIIMDNCSLYVDRNDRYDLWEENYSKYKAKEDVKTKIKASKSFVGLFESEDTNNFYEKYKFIFWSLMVLAVDKTDAEEHLALICDYAKLLKITEEEFEDIVQVVKVIYGGETTKYKLQSENVSKVLGTVFNKYTGQDTE